MSQKESVLQYLKSGRQLTPREARMRFGCDRLAARIDELRNEGHRIHTTIVEVGSDKRVASYLLIPQRKRAA